MATSHSRKWKPIATWTINWDPLGISCDNPMEVQITKKRMKSLLASAIDERSKGRPKASQEWRLEFNTGCREACLDGHFTADELQAIAMWMRQTQMADSAAQQFGGEAADVRTDLENARRHQVKHQDGPDDQETNGGATGECD